MLNVAKPTAAKANGRKLSPQLETRRLDDLRAHPDQAQFFPPLSDDNLKALAEDIEANGLNFPIEVLPKNDAGLPADTIVRGHQRLRALKLLKEAETEMLVRYDLADATRDEIDAEFLRDNLNRRQMDKLSSARVTLALLEKEQGRKVRMNDWGESSSARDVVGKAIGMSGRNLQRYWRILQTPLEVQEAFQRGDLNLVDAARVEQLDARRQQQIADAIRRGKSPLTTVRMHLATLPTGTIKPIRTFDSALKKLVSATESLETSEEEIRRFSEERIDTVLNVAHQLEQIGVSMKKKYRKPEPLPKLPAPPGQGD